ncbi:MAG TPA: ATP-binding protein [Usitatibacter sp.]|nr:ATP-binding protein [Usitatibacter sp.]
MRDAGPGVPLRRRLFLLAAAGILPLALTAGFALYALFQQQRAEAQRTTLEIARALSTAIDSEIGRTLSVLQVLSTAVDLDVGNVASFGERMRRVAGAHPDWVAVSLASIDGHRLMDTRAAVGAALPPFVEQDSVKAAVATRRPVIGTLGRARDGGWAIPIRVPVLRGGEVRFVLTALLRPDSLLALVKRQRLEAGSVVTAVDARGARVFRLPRNDEYIGTPVSGTLEKMIAGGRPEETGVTFTSEGDEVYTAFTRSPLSGWIVALGVPRARVDAAAWRSLYTFGGGIALSALLGGLMALVIARSINRPMAQLRSAAQAVGEGRAPQPVDTAIREIRDVSTALALSAGQRAAAEGEREALLRSEQAARAEAEAANRAKDEFLAMLGHELRNPLGAASNAVALLQNPAVPGTARDEATAIIQRQVSHLTRLTDDLLDAGRALTGKIVLRREAIDLAGATQQAVATLKAAGRFARHHVIEQYASAWAEVDPIRLDQIVANLLVNATKYTQSGGTIRVVVEAVGDDAVIRVADDGIGLAPELAPRVFDLFVQGERDLDRAQGGLGIGLTLVRRLAELHGGSASAHSEGKGRGSEFVVRFPRVQPRAAAPAPARPAAARGRHIVVVEDNEDARETLCMVLSVAGHRVEFAADGPAGLEKVLASRPEVALVDIGLPGIDGYELARQVRAAGESQPYLVALTGYGLPDDRRRSRDAGFDAHLVKPVDHRVLEQVLASAEAGARA